MFVLQVLAPVVETVCILDRLVALKEGATQAESLSKLEPVSDLQAPTVSQATLHPHLSALVPVFDAIISPRNIALVALELR